MEAEEFSGSAHRTSVNKQALGWLRGQGQGCADASNAESIRISLLVPFMSPLSSPAFNELARFLLRNNQKQTRL
jgi:hypothetical protein